MTHSNKPPWSLNVARRFPLVTFFAFAYFWTWTCWGIVIAFNSGYLLLPMQAERLATLGQFGPFVAAIFVTWMSGGWKDLRHFLGRFTRWRVPSLWIAVSLFLLPATMLLAIYFYALLKGTTAEFPAQSWFTLPAHFVYTLLLAGPLGEEPG